MADPSGLDRGPRLALIGGFSLRHDDRAVELPLGAQRMLAYLALAGCSSTRTSSAETLWPDSRRRQAAANLRTALWRVRCQVPDAVLTAPGRIALADEVAVDAPDAVRRIRALIDLPGAEAASACVDPDTLALLSTPLLPGWYDDWVVIEQERWDHLRVHALEAAGEILLVRGLHVLALEAGLLAARSEPLRESAHRLIIRIHLAEGNWGAAVQHYLDYKRQLHREMNLVPTTAMDELVHPLLAAPSR